MRTLGILLIIMLIKMDCLGSCRIIRYVLLQHKKKVSNPLETKKNEPPLPIPSWSKTVLSSYTFDGGVRRDRSAYSIHNYIYKPFCTYLHIFLESAASRQTERRTPQALVMLSNFYGPLFTNPYVLLRAVRLFFVRLHD
jgi:hypothetical protein